MREASPPGRRGRRASTLTVRAAAVTALVAVLSVVATALVAVPVTVRAANREARQALTAETRLIADLLATRSGDGEALARRLRARHIEIYVISSGQPDRPGVPAALVRAVTAGRETVPRLAVVGARTRLVAGAPVPGRSGSGVVLATAPVTAAGSYGLIWRRLSGALIAGLIAGLLAGMLLARWLVRPIRQAASAAARLTAGDRSVRLAPDGPAEAIGLAGAINELAAALETSEGRQRDFLLSVSHELRTPLTTIRGYAEALADGVVGPDGAQRAGSTVLDEAERLDRLITDLLVLARLEAADLPIELVTVDLEQLVATTGEAWGARFAAAGVPLRVELPGSPVVVHTDPGRIRQIVDGLLENALRVVPPGAPVVVAARQAAPTTPVAVAQAAPGAPVAVAQAAPGGLPPARWFAVVEVRDGGPGLTDDDLVVAFERGALYRRYQGIRKVGSGLGLALAARLARRLGGSVAAGHAPEGGAMFRVALPAADPQAQGASPDRGAQATPYQARTSP